MSFNATSLLKEFESQRHQRFFETPSAKPIWRVLQPTLRALSQIQSDDTTLDAEEHLASILNAVETAEIHQNNKNYADLKLATDQMVVFVMASIGPSLELSVKRQAELTSSVGDLEGKVEDLSSRHRKMENNRKTLTKKLETDANEFVEKELK